MLFSFHRDAVGYKVAKSINVIAIMSKVFKKEDPADQQQYL